MKDRIYYFDNLKLLLIFLVMIGHFFSPFKNIHIVASLYTFIYIFHMPCFVFVTGYFSKGIIKDGRFVKTKILNYVLLYLIMQLFMIIVFQKNFTLVVPDLALWYLQSVTIWVLLLPIIKMFKKKTFLVIAIILGLLVGFDGNAGSVLSIGRTISFMPFFVLGYYASKEHIFSLFTKRNKIISVFLIISAIFLLYFFVDNYSGINRLSYGKISYEEIGIGFMGVIYKLIHYISAVILGLSVMILVPTKKFKITKLGSKTLQIFCLHIPLAYAFRLFEFKYYFDTPEKLIFLFISVIILLFILSSKVLSYPFDAIMNIKFKKLLKNSDN